MAIASAGLGEQVNEDGAGERPPRILVINWRDIRNPAAGGAEVATHEIAKRWAGWGHHVTYFAPGFRGAASSQVVDGVRIVRFGRLRGGTFHALLHARLRRLKGVDVILDSVNAIPSFSPLQRRQLPPIVALVHQLGAEVWDAELPRPLSSFARRIEPSIYRTYADIPAIVHSDSTRDDLRALGFGRTCVVPIGIDPPPPLHGIGKERLPTFLFAGRLAANKRPGDAVRAFRFIRNALPDARLWVVGRGPLEARIRAEAPGGVEILGYLSREELYERMARAHVLLVPSVREGWGLVVVEANSVGTPAVGYDVAGLRDSIRHGVTGSLAAAGDPSAIAAQAIRLVEGPDYDRVRASALEWASRFSWDATASRMLEVLVNVVDGAYGSQGEPSWPC
jgi:glycosyltransferase involved in cell wall biosynthesis